MSKYEQEFKAQNDYLIALLAGTTNPLHQKIIKNFRRHALLEICGRSDELLGPDMTVEHPVYKIVEGGKTLVLDGMDAVRNFYDTLRKTDSLVMWASNVKLSVSDWGFAGEVQFNQFVKGSFLKQERVFSGISDAGNVGVSDKACGEYESDAIYLVRRPIAEVWHYADDGRLKGEHVYEDGSWRTVEKVDPKDVITPARARELLTPLISEYWP